MPTDSQATSKPPFAATDGSALASEHAGKLDQLLRTEVSNALGNEAWLIVDLANRMRRVRVEGQEQETITLDGKPIMELWPLTVETVTEGDSVRVVVTQKYRTFRAQNGRMRDGDQRQ